MRDDLSAMPDTTADVLTMFRTMFGMNVTLIADTAHDPAEPCRWCGWPDAWCHCRLSD
jgi:hypothetical protein